MQRTKLEGMILTALKHSIEGDLLPKNPYCKIVRSLFSSNLRNDLIINFESLAKHFRQNPVAPEGPYKVTNVSFDQVKLFGFQHILELIDLPRFQIYYDSIDDLLPDFQFSDGELDIQIANSISGGLLFKSELIPHASSHPSDLIIGCQVFIKCKAPEQAFDAFAGFIFDDVRSVLADGNYHMIKEFILYSFVDGPKPNKKKGWQPDEILIRKNQFLGDVKFHTKNRFYIYWQGICRVQRFQGKDNVSGGAYSYQGDFSRRPQSHQSGRGPHGHHEQHQYQYIEVYKQYSLHFTSSTEGKSESFAFFPLGALLQGVFTSEDVSHQYCSFFFSSKQDFTQSPMYKIFTLNQLRTVNKKWMEQNIIACSWELLYLALIAEEDELRRTLVDSILQIISSDLAGLISLSKSNAILKKIIDLYEDNKTVTMLLDILNESYYIYKEEMIQVYAKATNPDILRFRALVFILFQELQGRDGFLVLSEKTMEILQSLQKITQYTGLGNLQLIASLTKNVPDYIERVLIGAKMINETSQKRFITYTDFLNDQYVQKVLHISYYIEKEKKTQKNQLTAESQLEDELILTYFNEYDIYDNIYYELRDIFFGLQVPNPAPRLIWAMETKALKYQIYEVRKKDIGKRHMNVLEDSDIVQETQNLKNGTPPIYESGNPPCFGIMDVLTYAPTLTLQGYYTALQKYGWKTSLQAPIPQNYRISDILSVSGENIIVYDLAVDYLYCHYNFNWDFVIRGQEEAHAKQIFLNILIWWADWLERDAKNDAAIVGFFSEDDEFEAKIQIDQINEQADNTAVRQQLEQLFAQGQKVDVRYLIKLNANFKLVKLKLNFVFVDNTTQVAKSLYAEETVDDYLRVFFKKEDAQIWYKIKPFNKPKVLDLLRAKIKKQLFYGKLNASLKLELINLFMGSDPDDADLFITCVRSLYSKAQRFHLRSLEAETLFFFFDHYKEKRSIERKKQFNLNDIIVFADVFLKKIREELLDNDSIYFESLGASVINQVVLLGAAIEKDEPNPQEFQNPLTKTLNMCNFIGDAVLLTYRKLIEEESGLPILF